MAVVNFRSFDSKLVDDILSHFEQVGKISMSISSLSSLAFDADSVDEVATLLNYLSSDLTSLVNDMERTKSRLPS